MSLRRCMVMLMRKNIITYFEIDLLDRMMGFREIDAAVNVYKTLFIEEIMIETRQVPLRILIH